MLNAESENFIFDIEQYQNTKSNETPFYLHDNSVIFTGTRI